MTVKVTMMLVSFIAAIAGDSARWPRMGKKEKWCYFCVVATAFYVALLFVLEAPLPNLPDLLRAVYGGPSDSIISFLKASES